MDVLNTQLALTNVLENCANAIKGTPTEQWTEGLVTSRLELLEGYLTVFTTNHIVLVNDAGAQDLPYFSENRYSSAEATYTTAKGLLYDAQARLGPLSTNQSANGHPAPQNAPKLLKITLPTFDGLKENWETFQNMFKSLIHENNSLADVDKLYYLKSSVVGEAKTALDSLQVTGPNYSIAWSTLELRYDHRRLLTQGHMKALMFLRPLREESASGLQTLLDDLERHRDQLRTLGRPVDEWDDWFVSIAGDTMDSTTRRDWEEQLETLDRNKNDAGKHIPTFEELSEFLRCRCRTLSCLTTGRPSRSSSTFGRGESTQPARPSRTVAATSSGGNQCASVKKRHYVGRCASFKRLLPKLRYNLVVSHHLCFNCLREHHTVSRCPSPMSCQVCGAQHHTSLHDATLKRAASASAPNCDTPTKLLRMETDQDSSSSSPAEPPTDFKDGYHVKARALIDACSESTFVHLQLARRTKCPIKESNVDITGIAGAVMSSSIARVQLEICTLESHHTVNVTAHVLRRINIRTPSCSPSAEIRSLFPGVRFADPGFTTPGDVDIVLGADVYALIARPGLIRRGAFVAQRTAFGWTVTGGRETASQLLVTNLAVQLEQNQPSCCGHLVELLEKFWALEEVPQVIRTSPTSAECKNIYSRLHSRDSSGRYVVPLPVKQGSLQLIGDSLAQARRALNTVHRRMNHDPLLCENYISFMEDYLRLGHMRLLLPSEQDDGDRVVNYLPHHAVWQRSNGGRRLRVVFNASCPISTGHSLNDVLHPGLKLQNDLVNVVMRWGRHRVAFCTDIKMMFRQIRVREEDAHLQRIVWRKDENEPEEHYVLLTVTYGEASAPYLALRTLHQLCEDEGDLLPDAVHAVRSDLYVDDFLTGADDEAHALRIRNQLIQLLTAGGFTLKKWVSNSPSLLDDLPAEDRLRPDWVNIAQDGPINELGLAWDPSKDCFRFSLPLFDEDKTSTKRRILAEVARLFDPTGWLPPIVVTAKMFIQDLWTAKLTWDETLTASMTQRWGQFRAELANLSDTIIPRWFGLTPSSKRQLHAFADASRRAIAAVIYIRVGEWPGPIDTNLVCAKTKLTPIRSLRPPKRSNSRMIIPRLELRAALLATRLLRNVKDNLEMLEDDCFLWSDSTTVLHWLSSNEPTGNDLVDNYVQLIQESASLAVWRYVPSATNPADIASRGAELSRLQRNSLWWNGPSWLTDSASNWPTQPSRTDHSTSQRLSLASQLAATHLTDPAGQVMKDGNVAENGDRTDRCTSFIENFSCLTRLLKALARGLRIILVLKRSPPSNGRLLSPVRATEFQQAFLICAKISQAQDFTAELTELKGGRPIKTNSQLSQLNVFLDDIGLLRVGGRLRHSQLSYDEKHPPCSATDAT